MSPLLQAALLLAAVVVLVPLVDRWRLHPALALPLVSIGYGLAADATIGGMGWAVGAGVAHAVDPLGLPLLAGALIAVLLRRAGRGAMGRDGAVAATGFALGAGATTAAGLGFLAATASGPRALVAGLLAMTACHGLVIPSPDAVTVATILDASTTRVVALGLPVAVIMAAAGWFYVARLTRGGGDSGSTVVAPSRYALAMIAVPAALLLAQSVAQHPAAPIGQAGEHLNALARPVFLAAFAIAAAVALARWWNRRALADGAGVADAVAVAAPVILVAGLAGGFGRVLGETGMGELLAETAVDPRLGLLAPFIGAAIVKTLYGSSLTAVLTTAGLVEPLLPALGLDGADGRALATLAIGAGATAVCHVNDPLFWVVASLGRMRTARALLLIGGGSAAQALAALAALLLIGVVVL
ncbi:MAG: GntP family permease [Rhodospirillales bacterium]|nr:MAG: GntP family permease [Rhodospirillales bacterium]